MAEDTKDGVVVGGAYVENPDFVPDPADMYGTFNTSGTGAHHDPATVSPIFEVDRNKTAREILNALDEDNPTPSSRVILPEAKPVLAADDEAAKAELKALAEARLEKTVVVGGPSDAEQQAAKSGEEGAEAAAAQEHKAAQDSGALAGNSGGNLTGTVDTTDTGSEKQDAGDVSTVEDADDVEDAEDDEDEGDELKGKALDEALEAKGLSKSGTVAEKRARLAKAE